MLQSYRDSIAPGTSANRATEAKAYITFCVIYEFQPLKLTSSQVCMYIQYLKNSFAAPTTVKNYLSGARTWIGEHGGDLTAFTTLEYHQLTSGVVKRSQHIPQREPPLAWEHIQAIVSFLDSTPGIPLAVKPCVLIGYHTFLRLSNLLSKSMSMWGGPHTLPAHDLHLNDDGLVISVRSTKTKSNPEPVKTTLPWGPDAYMCPAMAWFKYITKICPWALGPAFLTDDGLPLTPRHVVGFMRLALKDCKGLVPSKISMHSLRRGAVHSATSQGIPASVIKERGMWRSDSGLAPYLL